MVKKQIDSRIHTLIKNGVQSKHRTFFVLVGDKGKDQVVNLHWLLSQAQVTARPSVLWCYKKELGFSSHRKKREAKIKRDVKRGVREINEEDPFELFISVTNIRYTYYKETQKILGNTYGMCVLQDFEALTPNMLARTVETVEGGGIVVLLLKSMSSLKQLYTMTMVWLIDLKCYLILCRCCCCYKSGSHTFISLVVNRMSTPDTAQSRTMMSLLASTSALFFLSETAPLAWLLTMNSTSCQSRSERTSSPCPSRPEKMP